MAEILERSWLPILLLHLILAVLIYYVPALTQLWIMASISLGTVVVLQSNDQNHEAGFWGAYLALWDVMHRATSKHGLYLPWEIGKFTLGYFMVLGLLISPQSRRLLFFPIVMFVLLLPSAFANYSLYGSFEEFRQELSFNVAGPLAMALASAYFYRKQFSLRMVRSLLFWLLLPVIVLWININLRMPDFSEIKWELQANFQTSGGFGPNQVAMLFAFGVMLLLISYFLRLRILRFPYVELLLSGGFLFNSLLTFSRGGILLNTLQTILLYWSSVRSGLIKMRTSVFALLGVTLVIYLSFSFVMDVTGGAIEQRFLQGLKDETEDKHIDEERRWARATSGRTIVIISDLLIFSKNPLVGVGPGIARLVRSEYVNIEMREIIAAHSEPSRLLAEHGLLGLAALLLFIALPWRYYRTLSNPYNKLLFIAFMSFAGFFFFHSAMRTGAIAIAYALAFIRTELPKFTLKRAPLNSDS